MVRSLVALGLLAVVGSVRGQAQTHNLTPDGYWHNRYHALLSMASYGDYNTTCPTQTFTEATLLKNFPQSTRPPWHVVSTFGPTPSGCEGFTAIVPEMNKALIIFKGNYELEQSLPTDVVGWDYFGMDDSVCAGCTVNRFAAEGYMQCKNETNNWEAIRNAYYNQGLVFSISGHGLGGMHSLIASVDLNNQHVDYYSHNYGTPRTFNAAGAAHYNYYFNGEAGERGIAGNDQYTEFIPAGPNYTHTGTAFYYYGYNSSTGGMDWTICWDGTWTGEHVDSPECAPRPQQGSTAAEDHYFYFANVGQCGGDPYIEPTTINNWLNRTIVQAANISSAHASASSMSVASVASVSSASLASISSISAASVASIQQASAAAAAASSSAISATATAKTGASSALVMDKGIVMALGMFAAGVLGGGALLA